MEIKSATGVAIKTPFNPKNKGKIKTAGIKSKTCLDKLKTRAFKGLFVAWKNVVARICIGTKGNIMLKYLKAFAAISIRALSSLLKTETNCLAKISVAKKPKTVINMLHLTAILSVCMAVLYFLAP